MTPAATPAPLGLRLQPLSLEHLEHVMTWVNDREVMRFTA